jgi:hypothetical protein
MSSSRLFNVIAVGALAVVAAFAVRLAVATNQTVAGAADSARDGPAMGVQPPAESVPGDTRFYRSPPDECFDVPLSDLNGCRAASLAPVWPGSGGVPGYRAPSDECFDVPLSEAAGCRSQAQGGAEQVRAGRTPPDECFDVPLSEPCSP